MNRRALLFGGLIIAAALAVLLFSKSGATFALGVFVLGLPAVVGGLVGFLWDSPARGFRAGVVSVGVAAILVVLIAVTSRPHRHVPGGVAPPGFSLR